MEGDEEALRLERKTERASVLERLGVVGIKRGLHVLDAGAGTGAIARIIAELVGKEGRVVALDASQRRSAEGRRLATEKTVDNLTFVAGDVNSPALKPGTFDLIWCQFLFQYLADPDAALRQLITLLKVGGKIVVSDIDGYGLFHYPVDARLAQDLQILERVLDGRFDPYAGRKLFHRFRRAGLESVAVHLMPHHLYAGAAPDAALSNWELKLRQIGETAADAFGGAAEYRRFSRAFLDLLRDQDTLTYSVLFLVEGIRR
jgi:SAM-dependent methyltransferase